MIVTVLVDTEFRGQNYPAGSAIDMPEGVAFRMIAMSQARVGDTDPKPEKKKRGRKKK